MNDEKLTPDDIAALLSGIDKPSDKIIPLAKQIYNIGWDDGAEATYEHLKMCEEEQSGDPVSRKAVCEIINDIRDCISVEGYCAILERMKKLPPVNPQEPKTGEWQQDLDETFLCSECGSGFKEQPTVMGKPMFLWCPLCGAKMAESEG